MLFLFFGLAQKKKEKELDLKMIANRHIFRLSIAVFMVAGYIADSSARYKGKR